MCIYNKLFKKEKKIIPYTLVVKRANGIEIVQTETVLNKKNYKALP